MSPPSKRLQLLAHLKLRDVPLANLMRLLNLSRVEADRLVQNMKRDGLIEIKKYPVELDPYGKCDRIALKQEQEKSA